LLLLLLLFLLSLDLISGGAMCRTASYSSRIFTLIFRSIEGRCMNISSSPPSFSPIENNAFVLLAESSASATGSGPFTFVISIVVAAFYSSYLKKEGMKNCVSERRRLSANV